MLMVPSGNRSTLTDCARCTVHRTANTPPLLRLPLFEISPRLDMPWLMPSFSSLLPSCMALSPKPQQTWQQTSGQGHPGSLVVQAQWAEISGASAITGTFIKQYLGTRNRPFSFLIIPLLPARKQPSSPHSHAVIQKE